MSDDHNRDHQQNDDHGGIDRKGERARAGARDAQVECDSLAGHDGAFLRRRAVRTHAISVHGVDLDAYVAAHRPTWDRLDQLSRKARRPGRLSAAEVDELVTAYQATATHLSVIRSRLPDPILIGRLSTLTARGRAAVTGAHTPAWRDGARFLTRAVPGGGRRAPRWAVGGPAGG